jgi:hypothetical protein
MAILRARSRLPREAQERPPGQRMEAEMAVTLEIDNANLVVRLDGWHRWAALKREVRAPLAAITSASVSHDASKFKRGYRWPGSYVLGKIYGGTWKSKGATDFWMVDNPKQVLVIDFAGQPYDRWLLTVDYPEDWVRRLSPKSWEGWE